MAVIDHDEAAAGQFIPELWAKQIVYERERNLIMPNRISRYDQEFKDGGDKINIPQIANLTAGDVGADGAITPAGPTETPLSLEMDQWIYAAVSLTGLVKIQSSYDLLKEYSNKVGYALRVNMEAYIMALYSTLSQSVGTAGVPITDQVLINGILLLDEADAPMEDRTLVMRPASIATLRGIDKFVDANKTGGGKSVAITGKFSDFYGVAGFSSNNVVSSAGVHNLLFHKEGFMCAIQKDVSTYMDGPDRSAITNTVVGHMVYGAKEKRDDHAVDLLT